MNICGRNPNRTAPEKEDGTPYPTDLPQCSRTNGWSWPPHPFQLLAWLLYVFFAILGFGVFVPLLPHHWIPAGYICTGVMFVCHLFVHLSAVTIDPADRNVRAKKYKGPVPVFDRTKHAHVIENCHCYLCEVDVSAKSKHCSTCNKCVASFDHHCKWLNNCVGSRNYWFFLNSVISALLGILVVVIISFYVFIQFFIDPAILRSDKHFQGNSNETDIWYVFLPISPVLTTAPAILSLAGITTFLGLLSIFLLAHLLCFHIYLMWNRLSTYEYIMRQRHRQEEKTTENDYEGNDSVPSKLKPMKDVGYSGTLGYTIPEILVEDPAAMITSGKQVKNFHKNGALGNSTSSKSDTDPVPAIPDEYQHSSKLRKSSSEKKRKKKVHKQPSEVINDRLLENSLNTLPTACPSDSDSPNGAVTTAASQSLMLPIPAFPQREILPPMMPDNINAVQPAGPPAEYNSDSAESMDEIPVAQTRLGSTALSGTSSNGSHRQSIQSCLGSARPNLHPKPHHQVDVRDSRPQPPLPLSQLKAKRKISKSTLTPEDKFELINQTPTVYVTKSSGEFTVSATNVKASSGRSSRKRNGKRMQEGTNNMDMNLGDPGVLS
ncbi:palmitoyltransferase ZDHHC1 [Polypterus senegalus]|uniref:palmitoyltransferase ZDHHC1 n=1 Tax=Polypterus senegalus TaxID=55291 RepID=UPI001963B7F9|nr:palmitoyltransferase ZDHHC1 [Polypterus senegalus]XP_039618886.1 palmitoyltransferase ZDHHC1 [Polypterus senegalus]